MAAAAVVEPLAPNAAEFKAADIAASTDTHVELVDKLPLTESAELVKKWGFTARQEGGSEVCVTCVVSHQAGQHWRAKPVQLLSIRRG